LVELSQARELSQATSFDHPFVDTQEEFSYTFPSKIAEEIGDMQCKLQVQKSMAILFVSYNLQAL